MHKFHAQSAAACLRLRKNLKRKLSAHNSYSSCCKRPTIYSCPLQNPLQGVLVSNKAECVDHILAHHRILQLNLHLLGLLRRDALALSLATDLETLPC